MKKTITVFKITLGDKSVSLVSNKQAKEYQEVLSTFGVEVEIIKEKKVIEL